VPVAAEERERETLTRQEYLLFFKVEEYLGGCKNTVHLKCMMVSVVHTIVCVLML
jgi:hypothetical protein